MGLPGGMEWIIIAFVVLLLFGGKKIPELAKGLGTGIKNFKKAMNEDEPQAVATTETKEEPKKVETPVSETKQA